MLLSHNIKLAHLSALTYEFKEKLLMPNKLNLVKNIAQHLKSRPKDKSAQRLIPMQNCKARKQD